MYSKAHYPSQPLTPEELDLYLSKGWFRMGQSIFTCAHIGLNEQVYRVYWLRIVLDSLTGDKTYQKLSKLNSGFSLKIEKASVTPEKEELFRAYKTGISFEASASLEKLLYDGSDFNIYNTLEITLRDGDKLIAVGYFDMGKDSAAGISCFYDPAYKKHCLGKYLMYRKMLYCKERQIPYFYLGYFAPGCASFDYKLGIAKDFLEYFDLYTQKWYAMDTWDSVTGTIEETRQKLSLLQEQLDKVNVESCLLRYSYFQINLYPDFQGCELFDHIMFVHCFQFDPDVVNPIVVYDIRHRQYRLLKCFSVWRSEELEYNTEEYSAHLLKIEEIIFSTDNATDLAELMTMAFANGKESRPSVSGI